jgi:poly(3-hydroxybutyrate) depolymerase
VAGRRVAGSAIVTRGPAGEAVLSRRALLAAFVAVPLAACGSRTRTFDMTEPGVAMRTGRLTSRHWPGHRPTWIVARPRGVSNPPVLVSLHGKGGDAHSTFSALGAQRYVATTGLAVAAIDGGNYYWHARRSESTGDDDISPDTPPCDTGAMVRDDFLPLLARLGLDVTRLGLLGWSMGGYGALLLAAGMGPGRVRAVAPMSAALWTEPGESAPGAFDDAEDWARHNVFADRQRFRGISIRLVCGTGDPFYAADRAFVAGFPAAPATTCAGSSGPASTRPRSGRLTSARR